MSFVTYEPQGAVAYLIINRPEALNALNSQVLAAVSYTHLTLPTIWHV